MRFDFLRHDLDSARRVISYQKVLMLGCLAANMALSMLALRLVGLERVVLVPPSIQKSFWVENDRVSAEYLEQMGYFLIQLALNVTPQSVDYQSRLLLNYAAPASYGELKTALSVAAERLKKDGAATVFSPRAVSVDEPALKVAVQGQLTTFISDRRVADVSKAYVIELQYVQGRITIKSFKESNDRDPLDSKPRASAAIARS